jgi:DNA adenine methylase
VFFDLYGAGHLTGRRVRLTDANPDLIGCYRMVRDHADAVLAHLSDLAAEHDERGSDCYYDVRDRRFNPARARLTSRDGSGYTPALAAMLIYLNRTGYNGLFRLNRTGGFNVPAGRYAAPRICHPEHMRSVAAALSADGVLLECAPFDGALAEATEGDFVYCDPPYAPVSRTSNFASYTAAGFSALDQQRLQQSVIAAAGRGALIVLSNSSAPEIVKAYTVPAARRARLTVTRVPARRAINSRAARRGPVDELVITNAPVAERFRMARAQLRTARRTRTG